MNVTLDDIITKLGSSEIPAWAMGAAGILLLLFALRAKSRIKKTIFVILALISFTGAVWWHFHPH
jgi:hypothetical protein